MKATLKYIMLFLLKCLYTIFNYNSQVRLNRFKNILYSGWIRNSFGKCGKHLFIQSKAYIMGGKFISIGDNFFSLERLRLECWDEYENEKFSPQLIIGHSVTMNYNVHIGCIDKILIGDHVAVRLFCRIRLRSLP